MKNRDKTSGIIGVVLGALALLSYVTRESKPTLPVTEAYQAGQSMALVFGIVLLVSGLYYLRKARRGERE
jgi:ABC-type antimicrobial peptide transport system permease subunit